MESAIGGLAERLPSSVTRRYRPERLLATGGYGDVWLARQVALSRPVALKVLQADAVIDPEEQKRFLAEARLTASLSHPNIVIVLDHGVDDGVPWIAYEYVAGRSLREVVDSEPLTWPLALDAARQILRALEVAHAAGILHRDVKPENVLESAKGKYKVSDFGIAKWSGRDRPKTHTGALMGSPSYISPEQVACQPLTPACDVYGLGCVLFELLTGRVPFPGDQVAKVLNDHLNRPAPRPSAVKTDLPAAVDVFVQRALAKDPAERYPSATAMREAIDVFIGSSDALALPPVPPPAPARRAPRRPAGLLASRTARLLLGATGVLALVAVALVARALRPPPPPPAAPEVQTVHFLPDALEVAVSAAGKRLTQRFPAGGPYPRDLAFQVPDADGVVQVASARLAAEPAGAALADALAGLPALLAHLPADDRLNALSRQAKKLPESELRERVQAELAPDLLALWRTAATHAGALLAADLPLPVVARLLAALGSLEDLTLRLRGFHLPAPVDLAPAYSDRWRPFYMDPGGERPPPCDLDPGPPPPADARALLAELHAAPQVGGLQLPAHLVCASTDLAGRPIEHDQLQELTGRLLREWVTIGFLSPPAFPLDTVRIEDIAPFRHRATFSLAHVASDMYVAAAMRPRLLASLRVIVNGQVAVRLAQREAVDPSRTGGITCYHAVDPRVLHDGPNELVVEAVAVLAGTDEPPWTGFDALFVGAGKNSSR